LLVLLSQTGYAQIETNYTPRKTYHWQSRQLIKAIRYQLRVEAADVGRGERIMHINGTRTTALLNQVKEGLFIKNDTLESYVNNVMMRIASGNDLSPHARRVLVMRNPHVNAYCYGRGIYIVTVGLLGRLTDENQLAFVLAHEMAHDELGHIRQKIRQEADSNMTRRAKQQLKKIVTQNVDVEDIEEARSLIYGIQRYSREKEIMADSMALVLTEGAKYNRREAVSSLSLMEKALSPKYGIGLEMFLPLHCEDYPFQARWLNERLGVFGKKPADHFLFAQDSLDSHPALPDRIRAIGAYPERVWEEADGQSLEFADAATVMAEFETVEASFRSKRYDYCMYYALQLLARYPKNAYLVSQIVRMLIDLDGSKDNVSRYTIDYSDELRLVNNFLHNLTSKECLEVAFHFLSSPAYFNAQEKSHYYLLWKICDLTYRNDLKEKISRDYRTAFGENITDANGKVEYWRKG
jgi:hypothetical protein